MRSIRRVLLALVMVASLAAMWAWPIAAEGPYQLTILHTNDTHAHLESFTPSGEELQGGVARRYTAIQQVKAEEENVLLVDAGDQFQGTLFFNVWQGEEASHFMNALGYQAMAVGNHEFDSGPGTLGSFVRSVAFPVLSANLDVSREPELAGYIKPWAVLTIGGEQIGLIGLTTPELPTISSPGPNVAVGDPVAAATAAVNELAAQGINKIVCLSHLGYSEDQALAKAVDGIDVIVGGHSHTLLGDMEGAAGPYPTVVTPPSGGKVLIVQAYEWGRLLGRLDVTFDTQGAVQSYAGEPIAIAAAIPEDADIAAQVARFAQRIDELRSRPVGTAAVALEGSRDLVRTQETNLGNLICDAMLWKTAAEGTQICITNGGGIRASIPAGEINMGQVLEVLPFGNQIATFGLKGSDVVAALERGVSEVEAVKGQFPQVGGLRFRYDPTKPAGSRVTLVEVRAADGTYSPIDPNATYKLVTNDFMRKGGDGYTMFAERAIDPYDAGAILADAVAEYIAAHSPVSPEVEGRITTGAAVAAEAPAAPAEAAPSAAPAPAEAAAPAPEEAAVAEEVWGGVLVGDGGGAYDTYTLTAEETGEVELTMHYAPDDAVIGAGVGFNVYGPSGKVASGRYTGTHGQRTATFDVTAGTDYSVQVFNYLPGVTISYNLSH